ncbi:hypothetical protein PI126_g5117 [Phytophthora idaei]|nr:hypothetical protein PI126_g5117 [Phytophthora idaei]
MEPKQRRPPLQRKGLQHCTYMEGVKPKQFLADTDVALPLLRPQRNDAVKMPSNDARLNELEAPMQWRLDQRHILQVIACITNAMGSRRANHHELAQFGPFRADITRPIACCICAVAELFGIRRTGIISNQTRSRNQFSQSAAPAANVSPCRHNYSPPPFFPQ